MKSKPGVVMATEPKKTIQQKPLVKEPETKLPDELGDLFQQQIMNRASATTQVLAQILEQDQDLQYTYHWGINE